MKLEETQEYMAGYKAALDDVRELHEAQEAHKEEQRHEVTRLIVQKLIGASLLLMQIPVVILADGDATACLFMAPLGAFLLFCPRVLE